MKGFLLMKIIGYPVSHLESHLVREGIQLYFLHK